MYGPFHLKVSQEAEKTEFDSLPEEEKNILSQMHRCDPERHDIYVFFISPKYLLNFSEDNSPKLTRKQKKQSFQKADQVYVQASTGHNMIKFLGIFPTSQEVNGKWFFDFEGEALFEFSIPKICKLQLKGKTKNIIQKRKQYRVVASRTDDMAQWIFLKHWLESGQQLGMKIFCSVPKDLEENKRYVICDALVSQKGRKIQALNHAQVLMK